MTKRNLSRIAVLALSIVTFAGCVVSELPLRSKESSAIVEPRTSQSFPFMPPGTRSPDKRITTAKRIDAVDATIRRVDDKRETNRVPTPVARPAYGQLVTYPIDLATVFKLIDENSPSVAAARARVAEAHARLAAAEVQWLPNLTTGLAYNRFDGQTQNQAGNVFGVSRSNLFANGGVGLSLDVSDAIYRPLIEQRLRNAEQLRHQAAGLTAEFEAVSAYLDLVQIYGQLAINSETTLQAESMLASAKYAQAAKLDRSAGDVNRAQAEVIVRRIERLELEGKVGIASARLGKLLLLPPQVRLVPADVAAVPLTLIDPATGLDDLVRQAIANRPELAANREAIAAAWERVRKQQRGPWFPKIQVVDQVGAFGGGLNRNIEMFSSRNTIAAQVYWEIKNLGYGNRADIDERRAVLQQAHMQQVEAQARLIADIVEAAQTSAAKYESISLSEQAVKEATELYRIAKEGTLNVVDAKNLFDALRPLQALQLLNNTRTAYLSAIIELNKSQCRLLTLIGQSPRSAMPLDAPR